jgi:uncharacterized protein (DUF983 family)
MKTESRLRAMLEGRCPRCQRGPIFLGQFAMNDVCQVCGLRFGREAGYYTGAMYVSYTLSALLLGALTLLIWLLTRWPMEWAFAAAGAVFLLCIPWIFRFSRVTWIYFDRWTEPND